MALQIRRGTNKERLQITPSEGELIYVTDYELVTISASANVSTNVLTSVAHGVITNQQIRFQDTTKNGLTLNQVYYVASTPDPDTFTLKATLGGTTLDITGTYTVPLVFAKTPTNAAGAPLGINVTALWIGDGDTIGGVPGNTQGLDDLTDVTITTPAEGNTFYYDATTKQWKNTNILNIDDVTGTQNIYVNGTGTSTIKATNTNTNLGFGVLDLFSRTTATPVNGFGSTISFTANNAAGTDKLLGYLNFNYDDITTGSEDAGLDIVLLQAGVSPAYPVPGTVKAQLTLDSVGNLRVRGDLTLNSENGNNQSGITFNHPTANGTIVWQGTGHFLSGDLVVNGGTDGTVTIDTPASGTSVANIFNGAIGTINIGNGIDAVPAVGVLNLGNPTAGSVVTIKSPTTNVNGALTVGGNLTVNGTTTTVNSTIMTVDDPNLVLNAVGSPTDANANGGGITVRGDTDKLLYWNFSDKRWYFNNGTGGSVDSDRKMVVDLTDIRSVETTAFNKGQMFLYDGTNWVNGSNIKFNDANNYRPTITTEANVDASGNPSTGGVNTALRLVKDSTTVAFTDGAGTGIVFSVDSNSQDRIDVGRLHTQYDAGGAHDVSLITTTTNNTTYVDLIRTSKDRTNINNGKIYVDAVTNRVGINTVTPNTSLEVQGNAYISSTLQVVSSLSVGSTITAGSNIFGGGELYLAGSSVVLKNGFTGNPVSDAGFLVKRGNQPDATWQWRENGDYWNTNYNIIADGTIIAVSSLGTNGLNIFFNNDDSTPAVGDHANLVVKRGSGNDTTLRWNETDDRWQFTNDGSNYTNMPVATDTPTYAGLNTTSGNINVNNKTILYGDTGDVRIGNDLLVVGNELTFNYAQAGSPNTGVAGLIVERGDLPNTQLRWNNGNERWESTVNGNTFIALPNQSLDTFSSPTFSNLQLNAHLTVLGNTTLGSGGEDTITMNGLVANNITFTYNDTATPRGILGQMSTGATDYWFVGGAETGPAPGAINTGYLLLATGDDGNDPIHVRQYTGNPLSSTTYRELTLLDASGNTSIPNNLATIGDIDVKGGAITNSTGALEIASGGATNLIINPGSGTTGNNGHMVLGKPNTLAILTTNGTGDLQIGTGGAAAQIALANGANGNIFLTPRGTGEVVVNSNVDVNGNTLTLRANQTGTPNSANITGIVVERGDSTNAAFSFYETDDTWYFTNNAKIESNFQVIGNTILSGTTLASGDLTLGSNIIRASTNATAITLNGANVNVSGNLNAVDTTFSSMTLNGRAGFVTDTATTTAITPVYFGETGRKAMKVLITASTAAATQVLEALIMRDAADANGAQIALYGELRTGASLATYTADYDSVNNVIRLVITPASTTSTTFNIVRTSLS